MILLKVIAIVQFLGYVFLLVALGYFMHNPLLEGECGAAVGLAVLFANGFLFFSSVIALFLRKYYNRGKYIYFLGVFCLSLVVYFVGFIVIYNEIKIDKCLDNGYVWDYKENICKDASVNNSN